MIEKLDVLYNGDMSVQAQKERLLAKKSEKTEQKSRKHQERKKKYQELLSAESEPEPAAHT